ncbi:unnamed protein product, partial [Pleuronectes platessa]
RVDPDNPFAAGDSEDRHCTFHSARPLLDADLTYQNVNCYGAPSTSGVTGERVLVVVSQGSWKSADLRKLVPWIVVVRAVVLVLAATPTISRRPFSRRLRGRRMQKVAHETPRF